MSDNVNVPRAELADDLEKLAFEIRNGKYAGITVSHILQYATYCPAKNITVTQHVGTKLEIHLALGERDYA